MKHTFFVKPKFEKNKQTWGINNDSIDYINTI